MILTHEAIYRSSDAIDDLFANDLMVMYSAKYNRLKNYSPIDTSVISISKLKSVFNFFANNRIKELSDMTLKLLNYNDKTYIDVYVPEKKIRYIKDVLNSSCWLNDLLYNNSTFSVTIVEAKCDNYKWDQYFQVMYVAIINMLKQLNVDISEYAIIDDSPDDSNHIMTFSCLRSIKCIDLSYMYDITSVDSNVIHKFREIMYDYAVHTNILGQYKKNIDESVDMLNICSTIHKLVNNQVVDVYGEVNKRIMDLIYHASSDDTDDDSIQMSTCKTFYDLLACDMFIINFVASNVYDIDTLHGVISIMDISIRSIVSKFIAPMKRGVTSHNTTMAIMYRQQLLRNVDVINSSTCLEGDMGK